MSERSCKAIYNWYLGVKKKTTVCMKSNPVMFHSIGGKLNIEKKKFMPLEILNCLRWSCKTGVKHFVKSATPSAIMNLYIYTGIEH